MLQQQCRASIVKRLGTEAYVNRKSHVGASAGSAQVQGGLQASGGCPVWLLPFLPQPEGAFRSACCGRMFTELYACGLLPMFTIPLPCPFRLWSVVLTCGWLTELRPYEACPCVRSALYLCKLSPLQSWNPRHAATEKCLNCC